MSIQRMGNKNHKSIDFGNSRTYNSFHKLFFIDGEYSSPVLLMEI